MKKQLSFAVFCFVALMGLMLVSCNKEDVVVPDPNDTTGTTDSVPEIPEEPEYTILGTWALTDAIQDVSGNQIDVTPFYGENFQLTFEEDGTLILSDGNNVSTMSWTLDGDQLGFIQVPGADPVMYRVATLDAENLVIINGEGTGYVTTMNLKRL